MEEIHKIPVFGGDFSSPSPPTTPRMDEVREEKECCVGVGFLSFFFLRRKESVAKNEYYSV